MVAVNTNLNALNIISNLDKRGNVLSKTLRNLSSGLRLNQSSDEPGVFSRVKRLEGFVRSSTEALSNFSLAANFLDTSLSNLGDIRGLVDKIGGLVNTAANTGNINERQVIQEEIGVLRDEIDRIAKTKIGKINVFDPLESTSSSQSGTNPLPVDIAFIFDAGGSIGGFINNVKNSFDAFVDELDNRNIDATFSVAASGFRPAAPGQLTVDNGDATVLLLDSTTDTVAVKAQIAAFPSIGGTSQDTFSSLIETAVDPTVGAKESDQVTRRVINGQTVPLFQILVTDHHPEQSVGAITGPGPLGPGGYSPGREAAVAAFLAGQPTDIITNVLALPGEFNHFDDITTATGGRLIQANLGLGPLTAQLFNIADDIENLPGISFFTQTNSANEVFVEDNALQLQVGVQEGDLISLPRAQINSSLLSLDFIDVVPSNADFDNFEQIVEDAIEDTENVISRFEGKRNIVQQRGDGIFVNQQLTEESKSQLEQINVSQEADDFVEGQITTQVGSAALSLVNLEPNAILAALEDPNEVDGPLNEEEEKILNPDNEGLIANDNVSIFQRDDLQVLFDKNTSTLDKKKNEFVLNQEKEEEGVLFKTDPLALLNDREDTGIFFNRNT